MQSILPFVQTLLQAKKASWDKPIQHVITCAWREDGNLVR